MSYYNTNLKLYKPKRSKLDTEGLKEAAKAYGFDLWKELAGLTDGDPHNEPAKHHQPCLWCGGKDRLRYHAESNRCFCNHCKNEDGYDIFDAVQFTHKVDFYESAKIVAERINYHIKAIESPEPKKKTPVQATKVSRFDFDKHDLDRFPERYNDVAQHRPEITMDDYRRAEGKLASPGFYQNAMSIVIPQYDNDGEVSGYVEYTTDGSKKNVAGTKCGIVGYDAIQNLRGQRQAKFVFKTAGVSDYLLLSGMIANKCGQDDYYCFTNGGGETERP